MLIETKIAIIAFVYAVILVEPGMILNRFCLWYHKLLFEDSCDKGLRRIIWQITLGCERCIAGQIALWTYLFISIGHYDVLDHICFVSLTIFQVAFIKLIYDKLNT